MSSPWPGLMWDACRLLIGGALGYNGGTNSIPFPSGKLGGGPRVGEPGRQHPVRERPVPLLGGLREQFGPTGFDRAHMAAPQAVDGGDVPGASAYRK